MPQIDIRKLIAIARDAGEEILTVYQREIKIEYKGNRTPLTEADKKSNQLIKDRLNGLYPEIPLLSEEEREISYAERKKWEYYWLIDPLDGTKEFIKKNGEFTVNIALINKNRPVAGVVYAPAMQLLYYAERGNGCYKQKSDNPPEKIVPSRAFARETLVIAGSRSHPSEDFKQFIRKLTDEHGKVEVLSIGSSLKICLVAEGKADIYPRLGPTMEWDTAAAHAVANEAGKKILRFHSGGELVYNKEHLVNDWFIVK
ncbi:3'(2'),5'-bisphosphate nucleotidase CysQ [Fibrobacterota bacterium]